MIRAVSDAIVTGETGRTRDVDHRHAGVRAGMPANVDPQAAGHPAEDRARAELRRRAGLRLRVHPVDDLSLLHELEDLPELHADRRPRLSAPVGLDVRRRPAVELVHLDHQSRHLRRALYRHLPRARPAPRDPARPENPRRGRAAADLPLPDGAVLHRHRRRLEVVPRSRPRPREDAARTGAGRASISTGSRTRTG